ncbi:S8 family serine peptidase [Microbacterium hominis]|uniref:S8 family serine peptidase n=1 Tax=Microbacterium hominis TaxID=162426 RepID=A0A7D4U6F4_9MICO|nr:S8 family serine peptidase [Microbacterium hominis]QKJ20925.1 S8 family serine peptidase [Microbacterium hominis]
MLSSPRAGIAAAAATAALVLGAIAPASASTGSDEPAVPDESAAPAETTVTLITGDVVRVRAIAGRETVDVDTVSGDPTSYETAEIGGDLYVIPDAADPYLTSGALDMALFNVSELIESGYDDATSGGIPVIAQYDTRLRAKPVTPKGAEKKLTLASIGGAALQTDSEQSEEFWTSLTAAGQTRSASTGAFAGGISKLWLDGQVEATLDVSVPLVGAREAWAAGYDGTGATVVVLDSGIDAAHPDVAEALVASQSFVPGESVKDVNGHGTHVAATVVGSGAASGGTHVGVAPGADLVVGKVLADSGYGQDSWIIAGMEWAAAEVDADVVSMSLGDSDRTSEDNPLSQSLNQLSEQYDTLFVVAAGNEGAAGTVTAPGTAQAALTIAATDDRDVIAPFSSRGPRGLDDGLKPDMAAPGVNIMAARSQYTSGSGLLRSLSGTSMATPHVAGAAAILAAQHPDWSATRLKDALMSSTVELDYTAYEVGTGRLDIPATLDGIDATGSVYFGKVLWQAEDPSEPVTRTVTYRNDTAADLELTLAASTEGPAGAVDLVDLSADTLTVPAGGEASVDATASFADAPASGHYLGEIVATDGEGNVVARTTTGLTREDERYDLDVKVIGTDGRPADVVVSMYQYGTTNLVQAGTDESGAVATRRVAPGVWAAFTQIRMGSDDGTDRVYVLTQPHVEITDRDVELVLDARDATLLSLETPRESELFNQRVEWFHDAGLNTSLTTYTASYPVGPGSEVWVNTVDAVGGGEFDLTARWTATAPVLDIAAQVPGQDALVLDPLYQASTARVDGAFDLEVVEAGTGTPAEIAAVDAAGKALLVRHDPNANVLAAIQRHSAAAAAGAKLVIVENSGPGTLYGSAGGTVVPTVSVSKADGAQLRAAGAGVRVTGKGTAFPKYSYDIGHTWQGAIPADLSVSPQTGDLATITDRLADATPRAAYLTRYDCPAYLLRCFGFGQNMMSGSAHTSYVSAAQEGIGTRWIAEAVIPGLGWYQNSDLFSHRAGEKDALDWFGVTAPRQGTNYVLSYNRGVQVRLNMPIASSAEGLTGVVGGVTRQARLYDGAGTLLRQVNSPAINVNLPAVSGMQEYRYELDAAGGPATWNGTTKSTSAWTFHMDQSVNGDMPFIALDYDVPTDLAGAVKANGQLALGVRATHEETALNTGAITGLTLEVSFDEGTTWSTAKTTRAGDLWSTKVAVPKGATSLSLRTSAEDAVGNAVTQEIISAAAIG